MREVPSIPAGLDPKLRNVLSAVRESLNAAIKNINLNTESLAGMTQWIQPALDSSTDLVTFNESLIQSTLESATGADGAAGVSSRTVSLETPDQAFTYDTSGAHPLPASAVITATALNTLGVVYYEFFVNDVSTGVATTTNTYTYTPQVLFDSMPDKLEVQIREDSLDGDIEARDQMSMIGLRAGSHGIVISVPNDSHTLPRSTAGVVNYVGSGTKINVWEGATALTEDAISPYANSTFRVTAVGTGITPGTTTGAGTTTLTYGDSSNMTTDPAKIIFTIIAKREDGTEMTFTHQQSLSFSQQGTAGAAGDSVDIVFVRSATQPATPTASPGTPTAPITWYTDVASVPASANPLWSSVGFKTSASANYTWSTPVKIEGTSVAEVTVFTRGVPTTTPTGGTYTFSTPPVLTVPTSTGATWYTSIPLGTTAVYTSRAVVSTSAGNTSAVAITGWTNPVISFQNGANGADAVLSDLSNDNHTVPTDSSGSNGNFTGCATTMSVFIGSADDSANWTYAVTKSAGVTCTDITSRTQAVTAMTSDTGTVTIVASKAGFASQTQVFSISKAKSGVAYSINLSNNSVRKSALGALSPASLTLTASKIDVSGVTAYTGRFKIYLNGSGTATYTSATDEASHPYTVTGTDTTIKCELYLAGGTTTLVDTETVLVVADGTNGDPGAAGARGNFTAVIIVPGKSWPDGNATVNAQAYAAIIALPGSGGVLRLGDSVAAVDTLTSPPGATWVLTKQVTAVGNPGTWSAQAKVLDGNLLVTGSVKAAMLQAGVNPLVSGTTMSGQGGIINSDGTFALGNPVVSGIGANISYNGTTMTLNGNVVGGPNIKANAVSWNQYYPPSAISTVSYTTHGTATDPTTLFITAQCGVLATVSRTVILNINGVPVTTSIFNPGGFTLQLPVVNIYSTSYSTSVAISLSITTSGATLSDFKFNVLEVGK